VAAGAAPSAGILVGGVAGEAGAWRGAGCEPQHGWAMDVLVGERSRGTTGVRREQRRPFSSRACIFLPPFGPPAPSSSPSLPLPAAELELLPQCRYTGEHGPQPGRARWHGRQLVVSFLSCWFDSCLKNSVLHSCRVGIREEVGMSQLLAIYWCKDVTFRYFFGFNVLWKKIFYRRLGPNLHVLQLMPRTFQI
jgi:hypothetical protein